jgi:hypothetical protein
MLASTSAIWTALSLFSYRRELGELPTSIFSTFAAWRHTLRAGDTLEHFQVKLVLKSEEHLPLFWFAGDGERMTGLIGVLMGDSVLDFQAHRATLPRVQPSKRATSALPILRGSADGRQGRAALTTDDAKVATRRRCRS